MPERPPRTTGVPPVRDDLSRVTRHRLLKAIDEGPDAIVETVAALLAEQREEDLRMHHAYRADAVAEIAVHLGEEADWDEIAKWCGGTVGSTPIADTGEYSGHITLPSGEAATEGSWITLGHDGQFRVRADIQGPEVDLAVTLADRRNGAQQ